MRAGVASTSATAARTVGTTPRANERRSTNQVLPTGSTTSERTSTSAHGAPSVPFPSARCAQLAPETSLVAAGG